MKQKITTLFIAFSLSLSVPLSAQQFIPLGSDPQGDTPSFGMDAKSFAVAVDTTLDSIWFRLEAHDTIQGDWGFKIGIDNNENPNDGATWDGNNNTSLNYDRRINFLNNVFFPPTFTVLVDDSGGVINDSIDFSFLNPFTIQVNLKLSDIDDDPFMNIIVGTGSFDDFIHDDLPDSGYFSLGQVLGISSPGEVEFKIGPNPASTQLMIDYQFALGTAREFTLFSIDGRPVMQKAIRGTSGAMQFDVSELTAGYYFYRLTSTNGGLQQTGKLVIAR